MANKKATSKATQMAMSPSGMMQSSGMVKAGDMVMKPSAAIASMMNRPTGRKPAGRQSRRK